MGIAGFGAIGQSVAAAFATQEGMPGLRLTAIGARDAAKVRATLPPGLPVPPEVVGVADLAAHADIVIECAPAALLCSIAEPVLRAGRTIVVLSCGALLDAMHLVELAQIKWRTHPGPHGRAPRSGRRGSQRPRAPSTPSA